ncbi:MAG: tRNA pseudouridine(38-40) synthase TruA [Chlamydiales bacterium]|nr:tRNA pseudouridine(38-40) synthase TruA [Chlamydiales bacterium]
MKNLCLTISYDGSPFLGWQKTNAGPSVEGSLQNVLEQILQEPVCLQAASRTDRGVHAFGQVVNFFTKKAPPKIISINRLLPDTVRVLDMRIMPSDFHPSLDARGKLYSYNICFGPLQLPFHRAFSWHVPAEFELSFMRQAADLLTGEHDFSSFCNVHENLNYSHKYRRIDRIDFTLIEPGRLRIDIKGNHFLYKMARNIVGTLAYVAMGKLAVEAIPEILAAKERPFAGITAPAHGLTLQKVYY